MRKIVLFFVFLIAGQAIANDFIFDKKYYQCENKWVVLPKSDTDNSYLTGVVYLDRAAGFTFSYEGDITLKDGKYTFKGIENSTHMIHRLPQNFALIAIIPDNVIKNLGLPKEPSWLDVYRKGEDETDALVRRGWHFNHVGGSDLAIPILLKPTLKIRMQNRLSLNLVMRIMPPGSLKKLLKYLLRQLNTMIKISGF